MQFFLLVAGSAIPALALPRPSPVHLARAAAVSPQVASVSVVANVTDTSFSRDSCASMRIGDRALWTCRDTEGWSDGAATSPFFSNTASWTDFNKDGTPAIITDGPVGVGSDGMNPILQMYGGDWESASTPYYKTPSSDGCGTSGFCSDNTRWAIWPNSRPLVVERSDGGVTAYSWIPNAHLKGLTALISEEARILYKLEYTPSSNKSALPSVSIVNDAFWAEGQIGYGDYGHVARGGMAYLYGQTSSGGTTVAKVPVDSVEDHTKYEYYVNGAWTPTMPAIGDDSAIISNAGTSQQGTFYYSPYLSSYVWIGQGSGSGATFYLTTAPAPEGPWIEPYQIYSGEGGNGEFSAYTLQAHPALLKSPHQKGIYITWTQQWESIYLTPLAYVAWK